MQPKGQMMGFDVDDIAIVPVASALRLFNQDELFEIDLVYSSVGDTARVEAEARRVLTTRHGDEDFTVTTQEAMLDVFGKVMDVITMSVGAIAGISLLVGATGILTMMWIAVGERTGEIGLLRALGATAGQVQAVFLAEAVALATLGGVAGISFGLGLGWLLRVVVPGLPVETPMRFVLAGLVVSFATGVVAGVAPARRAAALDPIEALRAE
jgi:putative ABC transport system permease protein